jgi:hypothetical protein
LIAIDSAAGLDSGQVETLYNQSYALVAWLSRFRRRELASYLSIMLQHEPGELSAEDQIASFEKAFGDVHAIERAWLRYERGQLDGSFNSMAAAYD